MSVLLKILGLNKAKDNKGEPKKKKNPVERVRETIETIVFVVVLVLLLKLFAVEAFVIPTGSMAESLYGYHKWVDCPECGYKFPINCSDEVEPQGGALPTPVTECKCPNCRTIIENDLRTTRLPTDYYSGDRVLVLKPLYHLTDPQPGHVVVFKYPVTPQVNHSAQNYIKRLWGTGGQTIAIHRGKLFVHKSLPQGESSSSELDRWHKEYNTPFTDEAKAVFNAARVAGFPEGVNSFELIRKPDDAMLEMKRIVYHNDYQSKNLAEKGYPPRWAERDTTGSWSLDNQTMPKVFTHTGDTLTFIRYKHLVQNAWSNPPNAKEERITNLMGYNTSNMGLGKRKDPGEYWTGDLILEFKAKLGANGQLVAELSRGMYRYRVKFGEGQIKLTRWDGTTEMEMAAMRGPIEGPGEYEIRFANVDCRLRVWVKKSGLLSGWKKVDFGKAGDYAFSPVTDSDPVDTHREGLTQANDLAAPASIGAVGDVEVKSIALYRDTVFTHHNEARFDGGMPDNMGDTVEPLRVPPGHYLVLGDNSAQSSDGRDWGLVPERLMMGRAVFVFFPFPPASPKNRFGIIR